MIRLYARSAVVLQTRNIAWTWPIWASAELMSRHTAGRDIRHSTTLYISRIFLPLSSLCTFSLFTQFSPSIFQQGMLKYWLPEKLVYSKVQVHSWSYVRHSEYALYACVRTQLASPAESATTIIIVRLWSPSGQLKPISLMSGRQSIYATRNWERRTSDIL